MYFLTNISTLIFYCIQRNATARGAYEAKTGINNREETGQFFKFNGKAQLDWWSGDKCNEIKYVLKCILKAMTGNILVLFLQQPILSWSFFFTLKCHSAYFVSHFAHKKHLT